MAKARMDFDSFDGKLVSEEVVARWIAEVSGPSSAGGGRGPTCPWYHRT